MDIEKFIPQCIKQIPTHMDFAGQKYAERLFQTIIISFAVVGFVWGYICQQFSQTWYILIAGFIISCAFTLPAWPMYRKSPLKWQKPRPQPEEVGSSSAPAQSPSQKSKKKK